jgi:hypothetical protein
MAGVNLRLFILLGPRSSKTQHIPAVVFYLERAQTIPGVFERPVHWNRSLNKLSVERVRIRRMDIGVPTGPLMT